MVWTYYDFSSNWNTFLPLWKTPYIQEGLHVVLNEYTTLTGSFYPWECGQPIWFLTESNFWDDRAYTRAVQKVNNDHMTKSFNKTYDVLPWVTPTLKKTREHRQHCFDSLVLKQLIHDFYPQDDTLESLVLVDGINVVAPILHKLALQTFPNNTVIWTMDNFYNDVILIPDHRIVFDLEGFFFHEIEKIDALKYNISRNSDMYDLLVFEHYFGSGDSELDTDSVDSYA